MLISKVSLAALRTFSEVAKQGSLSLAADVLCISPSAVSHQMKLLEQQLDVRLFVRRAHGVELTEAGYKLSAQANSAMQQLERGLQLAKEQSKRQLCIACIPALLQLWLLPRLHGFYAQFPDIELSLIEQDQLADFVQQDVDLHLHFGSGEFPGLRSTLLMPEAVLPVCSPSMLINSDAKALLLSAHTRRLSYIGFDEDKPGGISWQGWFNHSAMEFQHQQRETRFNHLSPLIKAACEGHGIALGWCNLIKSHLQQETLLPMSDVKVPLKYSYYAVAPAGHFEKSEVKQFIDWLKAEISPQ